MPTFLAAPIVAIAAAIVAGILRYRMHVRVTHRQGLGHGPLLAIAAEIPPMPPHDQVEFAATNQSLQGAVFVREFGAIGRSPDGREVKVGASWSTQPIRLERNEDHRWEMSFEGLAAKGIDLECGVYGWVVVAGRDKPFRSRKFSARAQGNRMIPRAAPQRRPPA